MKFEFIKFLIDSFDYVNKKILKVPRPKIIPIDKSHLQEIIKMEMRLFGTRCNLNHIDISEITDLSEIFFMSKFNGDISKWNTSKVKNMSMMFSYSKFDGDISNWDVSNVTNMNCMFKRSKFNKDISSWNVSKVENMKNMFYFSEFNKDLSTWDVSNVRNMEEMFFYAQFAGDISLWDVRNLENNYQMFMNAKTLLPYWSEYKDVVERNCAITAHKLEKELTINNSSKKKLKI